MKETIKKYMWLFILSLIVFELCRIGFFDIYNDIVYSEGRTWIRNVLNCINAIPFTIFAYNLMVIFIEKKRETKRWILIVAAEILYIAGRIIIEMLTSHYHWWY